MPVPSQATRYASSAVRVSSAMINFLGGGTPFSERQRHENVVSPSSQMMGG